MKKIICHFILILFLQSCSIVQTKQVLLPNTEIRFFSAKSNGINYKLFISTPPGYYQNNENYPVLYLLDPDIEFTLAHHLLHSLANFTTIEPFIIVGIGYQNQNLSKMPEKVFWKQWALNRARDYVLLRIKDGTHDFESGDGEYKGLSQYTGGSENFKNFIEKELIPYIDHSFRTSREKALCGHSLGGEFTTWIMLNYPSIFEKYLILSPSLWVEKHHIMTQSYKLSKTIPIKAYFAVGSLEKDKHVNMINDLNLFYSALPKNDNFKSKLEIIESENHVSMVATAMNRGFKFLFEKK
jgi:uncharacterized protein